MAIDEESLHFSDGGRTALASHSTTPVPEDQRPTLSAKDISLPAPPMSNNLRLPIRITDTAQKKQPPRLLHPILHHVPMHIRFGLNGFLSNAAFMVAYNSAVVQFEGVAPSSTIYSVVYLIFIPVSHALISLLVFGWPERYIASLVSNAPIGLTAIALGALLTAYLEQMDFNKLAAETVAQNWAYMGYEVDKRALEKESKGEFYSSLFVLLITGVWTFVLSVLINSPAETSEKKEN